jgi:hypothetical protein
MTPRSRAPDPLELLLADDRSAPPKLAFAEAVEQTRSRMPIGDSDGFSASSTESKVTYWCCRPTEAMAHPKFGG